MANEIETVAGEMEEILSPETTADDAQAVISAEELMQELTEGAGEQTAENDGDGDQSARGEGKREQSAEQNREDKFSRRMRAALANQKRQLYAELGGSEQEIRDILRAHRAQKLSAENPKISPEAAKIIVEEREKQSAQPAPNSEIVQGIQGLIEDGWTREMLADFVKDETVLEQVNVDGVSVRKAAFAYLQRSKAQPKAAQSQTGRKGVPTLRTATAAGTKDSDRIEEMTDAEFDAFDRRVRAAMANGKKVIL